MYGHILAEENILDFARGSKDLSSQASDASFLSHLIASSRIVVNYQFWSAKCAKIGQIRAKSS